MPYFYFVYNQYFINNQNRRQKYKIFRYGKQRLSACFAPHGLQITPPWPPLKGRSPLTALNRNNHRGISLPSYLGEGPGGEGILLCAYFVVGHTVCFTLCLFPPCPPLKRRSPLIALNRNDYRGFSLPSPFGEGPGGEGKTLFQMERGQGVRITLPSPSPLPNATGTPARTCTRCA